MLILFRGSCTFRQYIKSKAAKYGIKVHAICNTETFYCINTEIYCGDQEGPYVQSNTPRDIILRLREFLVANDCYASYKLAVDLHSRQLNFVGTVKKSRWFILNTLDAADSFSKGVVMRLLFNKTVTLVRYWDGKSKKVVLLSSMRPDYNNSRITAIGAPIIVLCLQQVQNRRWFLWSNEGELFYIAHQ